MISLQKINEVLYGYFPWMRGNEHAVNGTFAVLGGMILLLMLSLALITKFTIFCVGIICVYYGLSLLDINPLDNILRGMLNKFLNRK